MNEMMKRIVIDLVLAAGFLFFVMPVLQIEAQDDNMDNPQEGNKYYLGSSVNTGKDNGYSQTIEINKDDPHFGWDLGKFFVSGYTRVVPNTEGVPVFLKTIGDKVTLWFNLEQDINALNGDEDIRISADKNGYDEYFKINKTDFGHGILIIRHRDYQNFAATPVLYTDYLAAKATEGANTKVELFDEGDYEVALNYEIKSSSIDIHGHSILPIFNNYRIFFQFSVRNGNCMIYPFDIKTGAELSNSSITENGFYLDLAKSRYLDINIRKEILKNGAYGLTEDTRFNSPAKDGNQYTEEGIYTITVKNRYTEQETTKTIYVGTDDLLKAYVTTGLPITEIRKQLAQGSSITANGIIIQPTIEIPTITPTIMTQTAEAAPKTSFGNKQFHGYMIPGIAILACTSVGLIILFKKRKTKKVSGETKIIQDGQK